jgi:hypothetical protein
MLYIPGEIFAGELRMRIPNILAAALFAVFPAVRGSASGPLAVPGQQPGDNAVLLWNEAALQAVRDTKPGPTVVSRSLMVLQTCEYDAWTAYDAVAAPTLFHQAWRRPASQATPENKSKAVSFAAYRALTDLFPGESALFDGLMDQLGYDRTDGSLDPTTPQGIGNLAAAAVVAVRHRDGSNQLGDLAPGAYADYTGYQAVNPPDVIVDPNRWQPLRVSDGHGNFVLQKYTTPQWGLVVPYSLTSALQFRPPLPVQYPDPEYKTQTDEMIAFSAGLTDEQKMITQYWADGPHSEFPPGHWNLFGQFVSRRDGHSLDEDVKMFFALDNAVFDAGIVAWDAKRAYDSVRPITAIHFLYTGQLITAWGGPFQGTQTFDGSKFGTYQESTVVTPPFPEYISGHSTFSAAAAEVLKSFTGSDVFGDSALIPKGTSVLEPGAVPANDITLSWPTFSDAADQAGMSRRYGSIHFRAGDLNGRAAGRLVGAQVWAKATESFRGIEAAPIVCEAAPDALCLQGGRFELRVEWKNQHASPATAGSGKTIHSTDQTGAYWL